MIKKFFDVKNKNLKIVMIASLIVSLAGISVGFASLSTTLAINGVASVNKNSWRIVFQNLENASLTGTAEEIVKPEIILNDTKIGNYNVDFHAPGDSVTYIFDVANLGTFNAKLSSINIPTPVCSGNGDNAVNDANNVCNNLTYSLTYVNGTPLALDDIINVESYRKMKLVLAYSDNIGLSEVPSSDVSISNLSIELVYSQTEEVGEYDPEDTVDTPDTPEPPEPPVIPDPEPPTENTILLSSKITDLYNNSAKTTFTNNSITYNRAISVNLMNDRLGGTTSNYDSGNIRYYGPTPNNYIYFNCSDYSNQNDSTCEKWRIIGVFGNKVKLVRSSIGNHVWNNENVNMWTEYKDSNFDYKGSSLMRLLNPGYESYSVGGSLYWNGASGTCYTGSNSTGSCNFTGIGLKNDVTRNMISNESISFSTSSLGSLGGLIMADQSYKYENGQGVVYSAGSGEVPRQSSWNGKVSILYISDFMYATDLSSCSGTFYFWNSTCTGSDWLYDFSSAAWLISPSSANATNAWQISGSGTATSVDITNSAIVKPTIYLNSDVLISADNGAGKQSDPYRIVIE